MNNNSRKLDNICPQKWHQLMHRVLCDNHPQEVGLVYLFGQTPDNQESVLKAGVEFYHQGFTGKIGISSLGEGYGYPGYKVWEKELKDWGINPEDIVNVQIAPEYYPSTDAEAHGLVRFLKNNLGNLSKENACITAPPFHQVRCFMSTASALVGENANYLKIYNRVGENIDWNEEVVHSQGKTRGRRKDLLKGENKRIPHYQRKGNPPLITIKEALKYLDQRGD